MPYAQNQLRDHDLDDCDASWLARMHDRNAAGRTGEAARADHATDASIHREKRQSECPSRLLSGRTTHVSPAKSKR